MDPSEAMKKLIQWDSHIFIIDIKITEKMRIKVMFPNIQIMTIWEWKEWYLKLGNEGVNTYWFDDWTEFSKDFVNKAWNYLLIENASMQ